MSAEILRWLAKTVRPQTMADIAACMQQLGYQSRTYYRECKELEQLGFAKRCHAHTRSAWRITPKGRNFA